MTEMMIVFSGLAAGAGAVLGWWYRGRVNRAFLEAIQKELRMIQGIVRAVRDGDLGPPRGRIDDSLDAMAGAMHGPGAVPAPRSAR